MVPGTEGIPCLLQTLIWTRSPSLGWHGKHPAEKAYSPRLGLGWEPTNTTLPKSAAETGFVDLLGEGMLLPNRKQLAVELAKAAT